MEAVVVGDNIYLMADQNIYTYNISSSYWSKLQHVGNVALRYYHNIGLCFPPNNSIVWNPELTASWGECVLW